MSGDTRQLPNARQSLVERGGAWFRFFTAEHIGTPPANEQAIAVGTSPFTYTATRKGAVIINGGTVNLVQWARSGPNYTTGQTQGMFPVAAGDSIIINHTGAPNFVFVPF